MKAKLPKKTVGQLLVVSYWQITNRLLTVGQYSTKISTVKPVVTLHSW